MLTTQDDSLLHQFPMPFGHVHTSDKRWFDRMMFAVFDPDQGISIAAGLGYYINTNVADGFGALIVGDRQANVRVSRTLRPELDRMGAGGLLVEVREGLRSLHLTMDPAANSLGVGFDVEWLADEAPWLEPPHFMRHEGRVISDHRRFNQVGRGSGWAELAGQRWSLGPASFAVRDHSWGVRPGMGGYEGEPTYHDILGFAIWMLFGVGDRRGYVSAAFDRSGKPTGLHGVLGGREIRACTHDLRFIPGSRRIAGGEIHLALDGDERVVLTVAPCGTPMNEQAWGYQRGWLDRQSMGVPRGAAQEDDLWDLADPAACRSLSAPDFPAQSRNWDQPVRLRAGGEAGAGWLVSVIPAAYEPYGFER